MSPLAQADRALRKHGKPYSLYRWTAGSTPDEYRDVEPTRDTTPVTVYGLETHGLDMQRTAAGEMAKDEGSIDVASDFPVSNVDDEPRAPELEDEDGVTFTVLQVGPEQNGLRRLRVRRQQ